MSRSRISFDDVDVLLLMDALDVLAAHPLVTAMDRRKIDAMKERLRGHLPLGMIPEGYRPIGQERK